jgi:DNA-binding NarL/FixJ family response regulator
VALSKFGTYSRQVGARRPSQPTVRVLVADHQTLDRHGLRELINHGGMQVVAEATTAQTAVHLANAFRPDVVLMDWNLPGLDPVEATRELARRAEARVILLADTGDDLDVVEAVLAGACGCLLKDAPVDQLLNAVRGALDGEFHLSSCLTRRLADRIRDDQHLRPAACGLAQALTERESQILRLLALGHENHQIAAELHVSVSTVKRHVGSILEKLRVHNRTQAAVYAAKHALD